MKTIDVGEMRWRVQWMQAGSERVKGESVTAWTAAGTYWAKIETVRGFAAYIAQQMKTGTNYTVTMRQGPAIQKGDKLVVSGSGQTLEVSTVSRSMDMNSLLIITANESADA